MKVEEKKEFYFYLVNNCLVTIWSLKTVFLFLVVYKKKNLLKCRGNKSEFGVNNCFQYVTKSFFFYLFIDQKKKKKKKNLNNNVESAIKLVIVMVVIICAVTSLITLFFSAQNIKPKFAKPKNWLRFFIELFDHNCTLFTV